MQLAGSYPCRDSVACTIVTVWPPEFAPHTLLDKTELTMEEVCLLACLEAFSVVSVSLCAYPKPIAQSKALAEIPSHSSIAAISHWDRSLASLK